MKDIIKRIFALHVSIAYLGMLTGFGAVLFTFFFFYLISNGGEIAFLADCKVCRGSLTYLMFIIGPGALSLALWFYSRMKRVKL